MAFLLACHSSPLTTIDDGQISKISISKGQGTEVIIESPSEINFIVSHVSRLRTDSDIKVSTEFNVTFYTVGGKAAVFRLGQNCIGPNVPGSQYAKRWYFPDSQLYDFICTRFSSSNH